MKKIIIAALLAHIYQVYALFGIGGHVGMDDTSVKSQESTSVTVNGHLYDFPLRRDEISKPLALGAQMYFDVPVVPVGFELAFEGVWAEYSWSLPNTINGMTFNIPGYDAENGVYKKDFQFAKMGIDITGKWYVFSLPPVVKTFKFYVGGGAGFYFISPLVSDKMIISELEKKYADEVNVPVSFDVDEYVEKVTVIGYHLVGGMQLKMPAVPVAFNVDYKYVMTPENDYGDPTNEFSIIKGSLSFYL